MEKKNKKLFIIIFSIIYIILIAKSIISYKEIVDSFKKYNGSTGGLVLNYTSSTTNDKNLFLKLNHRLNIDYIVDGTKYNKIVEYKMDDRIICQNGETIEVLYNKNNPKEMMPKAFIEYAKYEKQATIRRIILIPAILFLIAMILPELRIKERYEIRY